MSYELPQNRPRRRARTRPRQKAEYDDENEDEDERFSSNVAPQRGMKDSHVSPARQRRPGQIVIRGRNPDLR